MTDYISREAAVEAIRNLYPGVPFTKLLMQRWHEENRNSMQCESAIERLPAADVRPVVLCKDCKWTKTDGMEDPAIYCMQWERWETPPDGFCWLGEKREA